MPDIIMKELGLNPSEIKIYYNKYNSTPTLVIYFISTLTEKQLEIKNARSQFALTVYGEKSDEIRERIIDVLRDNNFWEVYVISGVMIDDKGVCLWGRYKPEIGMSGFEVRYYTFREEPDKVNRDTTKYGVSEQWVYDSRGYLYFDDGILTSIQER